MLAEDTWDGGSFLLGDEAPGKIGGQHHGDVADYARGVAYMAPAEARAGTAGKGISDAQEGIS